MFNFYKILINIVLSYDSYHLKARLTSKSSVDKEFFYNFIFVMLFLSLILPQQTFKRCDCDFSLKSVFRDQVV